MTIFNNNLSPDYYYGRCIIMTACMCLSQVYSIHVRVNTDHVLSLLLEKEQFNIARKYAELVNSTKSQISIKEVRTRLSMHI